MLRLAMILGVLTGGVARADDGWSAPPTAPFPTGSTPADPPRATLRVATVTPTATVTPAGVPWSPAQPNDPTWAGVGKSQPPTPPTVKVAAQARAQAAEPPKAESKPLPPPKPVPNVPAPTKDPTPAAPRPPVATVTNEPVMMQSASPLWGAMPFQNQPVPASHEVAADGVPIRHGVYGSPNITLSRDYRFLDLFGVNDFGEAGNTVVMGQPQNGGFLDQRGFVQLEYLLWWANSGNIPVLASTASGQMPGMGFLGMPGTQLLLGPGAFGSTVRNGFRVRAGTWFDSGLGIDGSFFTLGKRSNESFFDSSVFPTIARPIFAPNLNREFGELVAFPGLSTGGLRVDNSSEIWGADINAKLCLNKSCDSHSEIFAGYRHLNLKEDLTITEYIRAGETAPDPIGTNIVVQDAFRTRNQFHGPQIGYSFGRQYGNFEWSGRASVALGVTHQETDITGIQLRQRPGEAAEQFRGGLLAAGPNIGRFNSNKFSVVPEATINLGYRITPRIKTYVGYNFIYWTNVLRPGDQIDRVVDLTFVPNGVPGASFTANRPLPTFRQSDLAIQGIQFGLEMNW